MRSAVLSKITDEFPCEYKMFIYRLSVTNSERAGPSSEQKSDSFPTAYMYSTLLHSYKY
jgi:hypothetical protein